MNYLGVDYGEKRIGLAKADDETRIAVPFTTLDNDSKFLGELVKIIVAESIDKIIIGIPISFDGQENSFTDKIKQFASIIITATLKPVELENEIFSSKIAGQNSSKIDESSAALILQSFLDRQVL